MKKIRALNSVLSRCLQILSVYNCCGLWGYPGDCVTAGDTCHDCRPLCWHSTISHLISGKESNLKILIATYNFITIFLQWRMWLSKQYFPNVFYIKSDSLSDDLLMRQKWCCQLWRVMKNNHATWRNHQQLSPETILKQSEMLEPSISSDTASTYLSVCIIMNHFINTDNTTPCNNVLSHHKLWRSFQQKVLEDKWLQLW